MRNMTSKIRITISDILLFQISILFFVVSSLVYELGSVVVRAAIYCGR